MCHRRELSRKTSSYYSINYRYLVNFNVLLLINNVTNNIHNKFHVLLINNLVNKNLFQCCYKIIKIFYAGQNFVKNCNLLLKIESITKRCVRPFVIVLNVTTLSCSRFKRPGDCDTDISSVETNCYDIICIMKFMNFPSSILMNCEWRLMNWNMKQNQSTVCKSNIDFDCITWRYSPGIRTIPFISDILTLCTILKQFALPFVRFLQLLKSKIKCSWQFCVYIYLSL